MKTNWLNGILILGMVLGILLVAGCESDDGDDYTPPPPGKGILIVNNRSADDILVFISGNLQATKTRDGTWEGYVLDPGHYRIVLDQDNDDEHRSWSDDVDILENRRTVLDVYDRPASTTRYDVSIWFD